MKEVRNQRSAVRNERCKNTCKRGAFKIFFRVLCTSRLKPIRGLHLLILCASLLAPCVPARAQQATKIHRLGFLSGGFPGPLHWTARLHAELQRIGYVEGKNLVIEARFTENKIDRLAGYAAELVRLKPDVIVTGGTNDARAAKHATKTIPIVMTGVGADPVKTGLVESLARPGGNVTGITNLETYLNAKRLELLKESVPKIARVALLYDPDVPAGRQVKDDLRVAAR